MYRPCVDCDSNKPTVYIHKKDNWKKLNTDTKELFLIFRYHNIIMSMFIKVSLIFRDTY